MTKVEREVVFNSENGQKEMTGVRHSDDDVKKKVIDCVFKLGQLNNTPVMKIGIVAVSRDCFPESLSVTRRQNLVKAYEAKYGNGDIYECPVCIVESEIHMMQALEDIKDAGCNALCV